MKIKITKFFGNTMNLSRSPTLYARNITIFFLSLQRIGAGLWKKNIIQILCCRPCAPLLRFGYQLYPRFERGHFLNLVWNVLFYFLESVCKNEACFLGLSIKNAVSLLFGQEMTLPYGTDLRNGMWHCDRITEDSFCRLQLCYSKF